MHASRSRTCNATCVRTEAIRDTFAPLLCIGSCHHSKTTQLHKSLSEKSLCGQSLSEHGRTKAPEAAVSFAIRRCRATPVMAGAARRRPEKAFRTDSKSITASRPLPWSPAAPPPVSAHWPGAASHGCLPWSKSTPDGTAPPRWATRDAVYPWQYLPTSP